MTSLDELRVLASQHAACPDALTALDAARSLGDLLSHPRAPEYAHWLRRSVPDLAPEARTLTEQMACQSPEWAYRLRDAVFDLAPVTTP